jgi:hypothetical protein
MKAQSDLQKANQEAAEKEAIPAIERVIVEKFPTRNVLRYIVIDWVVSHGIVGDMVKSAVSGAIGLSGPGLLLFGGNQANSAILTLFDTKEVGFIHSGGAHIIPLSHATLCPAKKDDYSTLDGYFIENPGWITGKAVFKGQCGLRWPMASQNNANAKWFVYLLDCLKEGRAIAAEHTQPVIRADQQVPLFKVMEIRCWSCKKEIPVFDSNRGMKIKCPQCGAKQQLPK